MNDQFLMYEPFKILKNVRKISECLSLDSFTKNNNDFLKVN